MSNVTTTAQLRTMFSREDVMQRLQSVLGKRASTFTTSVLQIVQSNDLLAQSDPSSVLNAAMVAATLDLPLNNQLGFAYIVPFNTRQKDGQYKTLAQFQLGYKGFIQLAQRSGQFKTIDAKCVYEGQLVQDNSFGGISFNWANKTSENVIGYAAYFQLLNGFEKVLYMTNAELQNHGTKYSKTYQRGGGLWRVAGGGRVCVAIISAEFFAVAARAPVGVGVCFQRRMHVGCFGFDRWFVGGQV